MGPLQRRSCMQIHLSGRTTATQTNEEDRWYLVITFLRRKCNKFVSFQTTKVKFILMKICSLFQTF